MTDAGVPSILVVEQTPMSAKVLPAMLAHEACRLCRVVMRRGDLIRGRDNSRSRSESSHP
jgi:hypothetical protein